MRNCCGRCGRFTRAKGEYACGMLYENLCPACQKMWHELYGKFWRDFMVHAMLGLSGQPRKEQHERLDPNAK